VGRVIQLVEVSGLALTRVHQGVLTIGLAGFELSSLVEVLSESARLPRTARAAGSHPLGGSCPCTATPCGYKSYVGDGRMGAGTTK